jgi:hypothetical protein
VPEDKWDKWVKLDLFVNEDRWKKWVKQDKRKSSISAMDSMSDFEKLQLYLIGLMVEYGIIATKKFEAVKERKLNALEIKNIVEGEVDLVKAMLSDTDAINLVAQKIKQEYRKK